MKMKAFVLAFAMLPLVSISADIYVSTNDVHAVAGSDLGWGTYVTDDQIAHDAYTNLQQAVNAAAKDDTVWVEDGFVCDDSNGATVGQNNPAVRLNIPKRMTVRSRSGSWEKGAVVRGRWHCDVAGGTSATGEYAVRGVNNSGGGQFIGFRIERCSQNGYSTIAFGGGGTISNCFVSGCSGGYITIGSSTIRHCVISNCVATTYGSVSRFGNMYDSFITHCGGGSDSGCVLLDYTSSVVSNCTFYANGDSRVNMIVASTMSGAANPPRVIDCVFSNNISTCVGTSYGQGLKIRAERCLFTRNANTCCSYSCNGNTYKNNNVYAYDCVFSNNTVTAVSNGGDYYNCLFVGNASNNSVVKGGDAIRPIQLFNCTLYGNTARQEGVISGNAVCINTVVDATTRNKGINATVKFATNCCFEVGTTVTTGEANKFETTAKLYDPANGIYTPIEVSPCYGAGSLTAYELPDHDFAGRARLTDGTVAIGAFECDPQYKRLEVGILSTPTYPHAPATYVLEANPAGYGTTPKYYWDYDGDGVADEITDVNTVSHVFTAGTWPVWVAVSNLVTEVGATMAFDPIVVIHRPVRYVKSGNAAAAEPYDTEENAAADIQTCVDFCANGDEIVVLPGTYDLSATVAINKDLIVRGSTGRPEDVIVSGQDSVRCIQLNGGGQTIVHSMTLTNGRASDSVFGGCLAINATGKTWSSGVGIASNLVARNGTCGTKYGNTHGIFAYGPQALVTHCVISNCHSSCGYVDGGNVVGIGLQVCGGAKAENCLVTGCWSADCENTVNVWEGAYWDEKQQKWSGGYKYGLFQAAALVGDDSVIRFCTIVNNSMSLCGGINVSGTGRFEDCVIAGNTICCKSFREQGDRYKVWSALGAGYINYTFRTPGSDNGKNRFYEIIGDEQTAAAAKGAQQGTNAVDVAACGLGAGTIETTTAKLIRNAAKKDFRLPVGSPAMDVIPPAAVSGMAAEDLYGNPRLCFGLYDCGACERPHAGMQILVR